MVIVFVDIWVSFGATWVVGIQGEQRMQNNQKVLFLDSKQKYSFENKKNDFSM